MRKMTYRRSVDLKTLKQVHYLIDFLRTVRFSAIDVSSPQLDKIFEFECSEEDLLTCKVLDFDDAILACAGSLRILGTVF